MKLDFIDEPELEFGGARRHVDIRRGLTMFGPLDSSDATSRRIRLGIVGTQRTIDGLRGWLEKCRSGLKAKPAKQPNLFPDFPGFGADSPFRADFEFDAAHCRVLSSKDLRSITDMSHYGALVNGVELVMSEIRALSEEGRPDVVLVALPLELVGLDNEDEEVPDEKETDVSLIHVSAKEREELDYGSDLDFHHMLKANAMRFTQPLQLILPSTYDPTVKIKATRLEGKPRLQDEATRAWNLHLALYYKANYRPWRIVRNATDLKTCFVGISFYRSLDKVNLMTSMAMVYDERGEGIIVRGKPVDLKKDDPIPHLSADDAEALLSHALREYRREHKHAPARVVVHKSSRYDAGETEGFNQAIEGQGLETADLLIVDKAMTRLFRDGLYPPLRGTFLSLDERSHLLYTRGSVPYYATYPGLYVPRPLRFQIVQGDESPRRLADELLALTKLNWNNTQFDGGMPITMRVASQVGRVLKYVGEGNSVQPRYSYYM